MGKKSGSRPISIGPEREFVPRWPISKIAPRLRMLWSLEDESGSPTFIKAWGIGTRSRRPWSKGPTERWTGSRPSTPSGILSRRFAASFRAPDSSLLPSSNLRGSSLRLNFFFFVRGPHLEARLLYNFSRLINDLISHFHRRLTNSLRDLTANFVNRPSLRDPIN